MKFRSFLLGLLAMTAIVACEEEIQVTPKLDLGSESVTVPAEGKDVTFTVTSNVAWTAESDKDWAVVNPASGDASDKAVTVTVEVGENDEEGARTAVVTVKAGALVQTFTINQSAPEAVGGTDAKVDGKQWVFTWDAYKTQAVFDFGVTEEGVFHFAYDAGGFYYPYLSGEYIIEVKDETTGVAHLNLNYMGSLIQANLPYSELTATSVKFEPAELAGILGEAPIVMTVSEELLPIMVEDFGGGEGGLDGYQWVGYSEEAESMILLDFSYTEDITLLVGASEDGEVFELRSAADYAIEPIDETSGVIYVQYLDLESYDPLDEEEWSYYDLEDGFVTVSIPELGEIEMELTEGCEFSFGGGEDGPQGIIPNGEYWLVNNGKAMSPLAEDAVSGLLPAQDLINGASTKKNIFTFTYDPDMSYYTIQDSYGRYLGQTDVTGNFTVSEVLPTDDTRDGYYWILEPGYGETGEAFDIYNASYSFDVTYSSSDNNWVLVDCGYEYEETLPMLVPAENPVEEPEVPAGPKEVTIAEFLAASASDDVWYQLTGTITSIANTTYGNFTLKDDTDEVYVYGLTATQVSSNDKSFSTLDLGVNDVVTLIGTRASYNGSPQVGGPAYYVSHVEGEDPVYGAVSATRADFETLSTSTSYASHTTKDGWVLSNSAVFKGGESDASPIWSAIGKVPGSDDYAVAATINGKTSAVGAIESPVILGGCGTLSLNYGYFFSESKGVSFKIEIIQNDSVVKTLEVNDSSAQKNTKYDYTADVDVDGEFKIKITNLSPSNSTSNKDRYSIWNLSWTNTTK